MAYEGPESLTAVVAAMEEEMAVLRVRLSGARAVTVTTGKVSVGWLQAAPVVLAVTGDGERNARRGLAALMAAVRVRRVIVVGVAGGLSESLSEGALVLCERVIEEVSGDVHCADRVLVAAAMITPGAQRGVAVSARRIADTVDEKRRLLAISRAEAAGRGGALAAAAVVDLESAAFAGAATRAGVPWVVLRAVSDTAAESVPQLLNRCRDEGGAVRRSRVVRALMTDPRSLGPLLTLRGRVRTCAGALAQAVESTLVALQSIEARPSAERGLSAAHENIALRKEV